jgi:hypothetical protein
VLVGVLSIQSRVISTVHGSAQAMNRWCRCLGHFAKSRNLAFLVLICKKCKILRFHDLIAKIRIAKIGIAKIGIAKIGIPILAIHPDRDPDFSDPDFSDSHTLLTR